MNQHELDQLLEKYLRGACTPEEEILIRAWAEGQPPYQTPLAETEKRAVEKRLWQQIRATTQPPASRWFGRWGWSVAAVMAASVAVVWLVWPSVVGKLATDASVAGESVGVSDMEMRNTSAVSQRLTLHDGSVVLLQPGATLSYPAQFRANSRRVFLTGEARFDVRRDPNRPFTVQTGDLITEVLGTSFTIRSPEQGKSIEVAVLSGKVSVYETGRTRGNRRNGTLLTPNQRVTYDRETGQLMESVIDNPVMVHQPPKQAVGFLYEEVPLASVLTQLSAVYALDIVAESDHLRGCTFTGDLTNLSLFEKLDLICRTLNAEYEVRNTHVFIRGEGCP
jgi:ferric-dicitrate binding protein FerR (iron transport regulator)